MFNFEKYSEIQEIIKKAGKQTKIIAISKNHPQDSVKEALMAGGETFGENRVQEAKLKFNSTLKQNNTIELHFTGPLQTNKVKLALEIFDVFHTLDREKLLKEFVKYRDKIKNKAFFIQINTGKESTKSGVYPEDAKNFLDLCKSYDLQNIAGLMCIPPIKDDPRNHFKLICDLSKDLGLGRPSIGMSSDYLKAIEFNPQYIRLGTVLFGKRK